jgi:hypothetical protein
MRRKLKKKKVKRVRARGKVKPLKAREKVNPHSFQKFLIKLKLLIPTKIYAIVAG